MVFATISSVNQTDDRLRTFQHKQLSSASAHSARERNGRTVTNSHAAHTRSLAKQVLNVLQFALEFVLPALQHLLSTLQLLLVAFELLLLSVAAPLLVAQLPQLISGFLLKAEKLVAVDTSAVRRGSRVRVRRSVALVIARVDVELPVLTIVVSGHDHRRSISVVLTVVRAVIRPVHIRLVVEPRRSVAAADAQSDATATKGQSDSPAEIDAATTVNRRVVDVAAVMNVSTVDVSAVGIVGVGRAGADEEQGRNRNECQSDAEQFRFHVFLLVFGVDENEKTAAQTSAQHGHKTI